MIASDTDSSCSASESDDSVQHVYTTLRMGNKKLKISIEIDSNTDDDWDDWMLEDVFKDAGLRKIWMHPMNLKRVTEGEFIRICVPLRKYPDKFYKYFRMSTSTFDYILNNIQDDVTKKSIRPSIMPAERLAIALRYLSTGMNFEAVASSFLCDGYTVALIVKEICEAIYKNLVKKHMRVPGPEELKKIADEYEDLWNFPNVVGAVDGKHIRIKRPPKSGTLFYNYKLFYSIVLQGVADANYRFTFVDVGAYGKQSDGGVFDASPLKAFVENKNNFPPDRTIPGLEVDLPYLLLADDAYPLKRNIMKPYSHRNMTNEEEIFNGRLSRARRAIECTFGILANKWRVLLKSIDAQVDTACCIVKGLTVLHNAIIDVEGMDHRLLDAVRENAEKSKLGSVTSGRKYNRSATEAMQIRNALKKYFNSSHGAVPWQSRYLKN